MTQCYASFAKSATEPGNASLKPPLISIFTEHSMLTLEKNALQIRMPQVHRDASCSVTFHRTLRIPDDNGIHSLPPDLGTFPLYHVDDYASRLPHSWKEHGGVFLPMHQAEAMWIRFTSRYPFAVKIASGKVNAVSGDAWSPALKGKSTISQAMADALNPRSSGAGNAGGAADYWFGDSNGHHFVNVGMGMGSAIGPGIGLGVSPYPGSGYTTVGQPARETAYQREAQDYITLPKQPWIDGFAVGAGQVRQFVAMPMGEGYTVEELVTGEALHGGLQLLFVPLKAAHYTPPPRPVTRGWGMANAMSASAGMSFGATAESASLMSNARGAEMGLAQGGLMRQEIYEDNRPVAHWDETHTDRCFVHLLNSAQFCAVTGLAAPAPIVTPALYQRYGYPWYDYYDEAAKALPGSAKLRQLDSVAALAYKKGQTPPPNLAAPLSKPVVLKDVRPANEVRNGVF